MYTTDLVGNSVDGLNLAMSKRAINIRYDFRIVDENGTSWGISPGAVTTRSRSNNLSDSSWQLTMTFVKSRLPSGLTIQQYHTIEIDRFNGGLWPYFRGVIQSVRQSIQREGGSIVETIEVTAEGVLSKLRGIYVPNYKYSIKPNLIGSAGNRWMIGICRTVTQVHTSALNNGSSLQLRSGGMIYIRDQDPVSIVGDDLHESTTSSNFIQISPNADFSGNYVAGTHYKIQFQTGLSAPYTAIVPYVIKWINATASASTIYIRFRVIDRFVFPRVETDPATSSQREDYFFCNRREYNDLMFSTVASVGGAGNVELTPVDTGMYIQGIHDSTDGMAGTVTINNREFLTITWPDGEEATRRINSINRTTGVMTLNASPTKPTGGALADSTCSIRVSTLDYYPAWDDRFYYSFRHNTTSSDFYYPEVFEILPNVGQAIPRRGIYAGINGLADSNVTHWRTGWSVRPRHALAAASANAGIQVISSSTTSPFDISSSFNTNRIEEAIKAIICDSYYGFGLFDKSNVITEQSGILTKNFSVGGKYLDEIIKDISSQSFPANMFIKDKTNGQVSIKRYSQLSSGPQYLIPGIASVTVEDPSEKITSVTVISGTDEEKNISPITLAGGGFSDSYKIFNGNPDDYAYCIQTGAPNLFFQINPSTPSSIFPFIKEIKVSGTGLLYVGIFYGTVAEIGNTNNVPTNTFGIEQCSNIRLNGSSPITIDGEKINKYLVNGKTCVLVFFLYGTPAYIQPSGQILSNYYLINEIDIISKNEYGHTASMTDNTSLASSSVINLGGFGTSWRVTDQSRAVSFRYAPTSWIKRNASNYGGRIEDVYVISPGTLASGSTSIVSSTPSGGFEGTFVSRIRSNGGGIGSVEIATPVITGDYPPVDKNRGYGFTTYPTFTITPSSGSPSVTADIIQHRSKVLRMDNISQLECRKYAESYMDEYLRTQTTYTVQAPLLDYAEPGDTVLVQLPDGSQKTLLLWGISDSGSALDNTATYTLRDYSL